MKKLLEADLSRQKIESISELKHKTMVIIEAEKQKEKRFKKNE